ncbi:unnamed protein product [Durusdinium trenchii]|uniref:Uncharacterized protein n=2 Tax=Durusdinium trenchii TaxID=1381693 RepID=A0ABP0RZX3_9DINO
MVRSFTSTSRQEKACGITPATSITARSTRSTRHFRQVVLQVCDALGFADLHSNIFILYTAYAPSHTNEQYAEKPRLRKRRTELQATTRRASDCMGPGFGGAMVLLEWL